MADNDRSIGAYINQRARRSFPVTENLEQRLAEVTQAVYGPGATFKIFSGGQDAPFKYKDRSGRIRTTSTRHNTDDQGRGQGADVHFFDKDGNQITDQVALSKAGQYWLGKGHGGVGMTMRGGGVHLDEHTDRSPYWIYNPRSHKRASSANIVAGARGDPGTFRPPTDVPVAIKPTTPDKPASVPLSDTPSLTELKPPLAPAPYDTKSTMKMIFPEGSQTQEASAPQALPLQQTSPTSLPTPKVAAMAPSIKAPKAPKLTATSESAASALVNMIRQGKDIKGLNPDFDNATPAMRANIINMIKGAPEGDMRLLIRHLETSYPSLAQPLGKAPKATGPNAYDPNAVVQRPNASPEGGQFFNPDGTRKSKSEVFPKKQEASPSEKIAADSIVKSDGGSVTMDGKPVKNAKVRPSTEEETVAGPGRPTINPKGVPAKDIPGAQGDVIFDQYGRPIDSSRLRSGPTKPPLPAAVSPMGAAATGAAGLGIAAIASGNRNRDPETGAEGAIPQPAGPAPEMEPGVPGSARGTGVGGGGIDDTGGLGTGGGPPNSVTRTIPPGHRLGPPDGSPRPPGAAAAPPPADPRPQGDQLMDKMIEEALGLPPGSLATPEGQAAKEKVASVARAKVMQNPQGAKAAAQAAGAADGKAAAARSAAPQTPMPQPQRYGDMGGSPTSYTDRMGDLAAQNPGMAQLFQFFAGGGDGGQP